MAALKSLNRKYEKNLYTEYQKKSFLFWWKLPWKQKTFNFLWRFAQWEFLVWFIKTNQREQCYFLESSYFQNDETFLFVYIFSAHNIYFSFFPFFGKNNIFQFFVTSKKGKFLFILFLLIYLPQPQIFQQFCGLQKKRKGK